MLAFALLLSCARAVLANGSDLPHEIVVPAYLGQDGTVLHLVVRFPLVLLASFGLPKRGPGYLDLEHMDAKLQQAALAAGHQIDLAEDGTPLAFAVAKARISPPSDRSFASYPTALAHLDGPPLSPDTNLFWNQGFFDTRLDYTLRALDSHLSVRVNVAPELGQRLELRLSYLPAAGAARTLALPGDAGFVALDPRWFEAAWLFLKAGFVDVFTRARFVFLLCLIAPFARFRSLLVVALVGAAMEALTLTAVGEGIIEQPRWLPAIVASTVFVVSLLVAIGNLGSPSLRRRWFIASIIGALVGFTAGPTLAALAQLAGAHATVATAAFDVGIVVGVGIALAIAHFALRALLALVFGRTVGVIIVSALLGLLAWQWTAEANHELFHEIGHAIGEGPKPALPLLLWMLPAIVVGALGFALPRGFSGPRAASLRYALLARLERERALRG